MLKTLELFDELNKFCPAEIWSEERLKLAASILDQLPANIEAGNNNKQKNVKEKVIFTWMASLLF